MDGNKSWKGYGHFKVANLEEPRLGGTLVYLASSLVDVTRH
jgi:hypothetical protein